MVDDARRGCRLGRELDGAFRFPRGGILAVAALPKPDELIPVRESERRPQVARGRVQENSEQKSGFFHHGQPLPAALVGVDSQRAIRRHKYLTVEQGSSRTPRDLASLAHSVAWLTRSSAFPRQIQDSDEE